MSSVSTQELLLAGLMPFEGTFADGQPANNKLDLSYARLSSRPRLFRRIVQELCEYAEPYKPEFTIGNPDGATGIAGAVALEMDLHCIHLVKTHNKGIKYATTIDEFSVSQVQRGVLIEDVLNRRSTSQKVLQLPHLADKISAVISIFDRGMPGEAHFIDKPVESLVKFPIAPELPDNSELRLYMR